MSNLRISPLFSVYFPPLCALPLKPLCRQPAGGDTSGLYIAWPVSPERDPAYPDQQRGQNRTADQVDPYPARGVYHRRQHRMAAGKTGRIDHRTVRHQVRAGPVKTVLECQTQQSEASEIAKKGAPEREGRLDDVGNLRLTDLLDSLQGVVSLLKCVDKQCVHFPDR